MATTRGGRADAPLRDAHVGVMQIRRPLHPTSGDGVAVECVIAFVAQRARA